MSTIILDFGSGNTSKNDKAYIKRMYDELKAVDTGKHNIICKWQLFEKAGDNIPLLPDAFDFAYRYGTCLGYKVTSSVFNKNSLDFLLEYDVPFVKIANNRALDWLIGEVPRKIPVYISISNCVEWNMYLRKENVKTLCCVSGYPSKYNDYIVRFGYGLTEAISDHTIDFALWHGWQPKTVEWHYKLDDSTGLDAGPFARTPAMLREVL